MSWLPALYASKQLELGVRKLLASRDLKAPQFSVSIESATVAFDKVSLTAVNSKVSNLVTLETDLFWALKGVMSVFAA